MATRGDRSKEGQDGKRGQFSSVFSWYVGFTSVGGLTQCRDSDNNLSRVCWFVLFICGLLLTIWNVGEVIQAFFAKEVSAFLISV